MKLQEDVKKIGISNITITSKVEAMNKIIQTLPTKNNVSVHAKAMDEAFTKIQEVSTG
jgi:hypothetical protein